jgi:hypothetical protein
MSNELLLNERLGLNQSVVSKTTSSSWGPGAEFQTSADAALGFRACGYSQDRLRKEIAGSHDPLSTLSARGSASGFP